MAHRWGKINHGQTYGLICDDVARRLSTLKLGDYEHLLLNHVREHSWARSTRSKPVGKFPAAIPFFDSIDSVARDIASGRLDEQGIKGLRKRLYEAAKSLKDSRILIESDGPAGGLLINTNCDEWQTYGREILPPYVCLSYSIAVQKPAATPVENTPGNASTASDPDHDDVRQNGHACPDRRIHVSGMADTHARNGGHAECPPPHPPIGEARASEDFKKTEEDNTPGASIVETLPSKPLPDPAYPVGVDAQSPNLITASDRAELDRVAATCDVYFPMLDQIRRVVSGREGAYPAWAYAPAVEELRKLPREKHRRNYFIGIVGRIAADGPAAAKAILASSRASPKAEIPVFKAPAGYSFGKTIRKP